MKKFILAVACVVLAWFVYDAAVYRFGFYIDWHPNQEVTTFMTTDEKQIYMNGESFEPRGVNLGVGIPGKWATDFAIDKETYLRWFEMIQELGANTIRVYTILHSDFYEAFYEYNVNNPNPLYLIHGVWVNDYVLNSHRDAFDEAFQDTLIEDCMNLVDILHGNKKLSLGRGIGSGQYLNDISEWVIGYIVGVEWEDVTVAYTDHKYPQRNQYQGTYLQTTADASPFEAMLAEVGDRMIEYETKRYKQQRLIAFSNWPTTDPFDYPEEIVRHFLKCAKVDVEHIQTTEAFLSGQFASYHVYPYYPDYLSFAKDQSNFDHKEGYINTYSTYLKKIINHHTMPVVISEYGVSTGRGMAHREGGLGRNQGKMSEREQGEAIVSMYEDIMRSGAAGSMLFTWQDEWFKRTWNTMHAIDLLKTPYWSDIQTNEQYFGLLAFDPGQEKSVSYLDGDISEWNQEDLVFEENGASVSMKYDEKYLYFRIHKPNFDFEHDILYLPFDVTPKSGSTYCENYDLKFEKESDFLLVINGKNRSRLLVQERYEVLRAMFFHETDGKDAYLHPVDLHTPVFKPIELMLQLIVEDEVDMDQGVEETYETGRLTYGNGNPESLDFDSLADFIVNGDDIELRLPWQMLNFANPSEMMIHDDYYEHYGIEYLQIDEISIGLGSEATKDERVMMHPVALEGWGKKVTYHERLKQSYYIVQEYWKQVDEKKVSQ